MSIKITLRGATELRDCPDCGSSHIGVVPCGRSFRSRLRSVRLDASATPTRERVAYYDDGTVSEAFGGLNRKERKEIMLDDTKGKGPIYPSTPHDDKHLDTILGPEL